MKQNVHIVKKCAFCAYWQKNNFTIGGICWRNSFPCDTRENDYCSFFRRK